MKKIYKILLFAAIVLAVTLGFMGCSWDEPTPCKPCPPPEIQVQYKTQYVDKPVPCPDQNVTCNFKGNGYEPTQRLLECVVLQKRALEACYGGAGVIELNKLSGIK